MRLVTFPFLVLVLLASAWFDDAWAAGPALPAEERLTATDDEYLNLPSRARQESARASRRLPDPAAAPLAGRAGSDRARDPFRQTRPAGLFRPPLLYLLMSLQR
jgi:hypothetical protein